MEEEKMDTPPQPGQKIALESLSKEEIINKYKGLLGIAKRAKLAKDEISEENRTLKEQLQQYETQKEADKNALMTMKEMLEAYTENKLQLTTQTTELQKQRKLDLETIEQFSIENESLKRQLQRLTDDNETLLTDIENMETQLQQVSGLGKEQKQHLVLLEKEINQLREAEVLNQELQLKNEELSEELKELKEKYKFIKEINTEQRHKFNALKDRFIEFHKKLKKLKECKRILLETQHEYADSVSQWQNEIIRGSKLLCKELNKLKEENMELLKKLGNGGEQQPKTTGTNCVTVEDLNKLLELSEKAKNDYENLQKENFDLKQQLGIKETTTTASPTLNISVDKIEEIWHLSKTAFQDYKNIQQENLQLKDKASKTITPQDQVDSKTNLEMSHKLSAKLEHMQKLAAKANEEYQKQSNELTQLKQDYEKLQKELDINRDNKNIELEEPNRNEKQYLELLEKIHILEQDKKQYQDIEFKNLNENKQQLQEKLQEMSCSIIIQTENTDRMKEDLLKAQTSLEEYQEMYKQKESEHRELLDEMRELNEALIQTENTDRMKESLLKTQTSLEEYQEMYKQKEIEHRELLDEMRELNEALKARGDLISRQQEEQQVLKNELKVNSDKLIKIQESLDCKDEQLNEKHIELETILKDIAVTKQKLEVLENASSLNEEKVRILNAELENLKSNPPLNDIDNQSDVLSTSTISRADELQRLRDVEDSFEDKYNKLRGLAAKLKKKLQEESGNKQRLEKELLDLKAQENELKSQLEEYKSKVSDMDSLQKQLHDKQKSFDTLKTENQKLKSSRKQANVLNLEIEAAEKSLTDVTNKLANRTSELDAAQDSIKSKESTITQLRKEIDLLESSKSAEIKHSQELKQQIDHLQKTLKDEVHSKQQTFDKSKILEQDVENLKLELENLKMELAQTTSNQELSTKSLKIEKEQLTAQLSTTQNLLSECEQKLKQSERSSEDLQVEYLDYKVKAQAVLRKNQNRDSSKERELEEELIAMRAAETQLNTNIQTLSTKLEALDKQKDLMANDNNNLQKRCKELMQLIEEMRSQNDSLNQEIQQHMQQQHETLKQHRQQIESMDNCHKEQLQSLNNSHQRQLEHLRKELSTHIRLPPSIGATKSASHHHSSFNDQLHHPHDQSKLDFLFMEREDAEGSEEAAETLANLAASRKISNASSSKRSTHDFMPLDELLNTPMNAIHSETLVNNTLSQQQVPDILNANPTTDVLQLELNTSKERLQKQESRIRHLTALLSENEQDLAKLTQMNDMLKEELRRQERSVEREQHMHNSEYVKNVILKFLTLNNADEKIRLVPVLNTILKLSRPETEMLNCVAKGQKVSDTTTQRTGGWGNFLPWGSGGSNNNSSSSNN